MMLSGASSRAEKPPEPDAGLHRDRWSQLREQGLPYLLLFPTGAILVAVLAYPWAWSLIVSFYHWSAISPAPATFVGLDNYVSILSSGDFWHSFRLTLILVAITVPSQMILGFLLAYLLNTDLIGRGIIQTILIMPMMVVPVMVGIAWLVILHPVYGVLPYWFAVLGLPEIGWMTNPWLAIVTVSIIEIWRNTPLVMLVLLAGLRSLPLELAEAAKIDGASQLQYIRYVLLPGIRPFVMFCLLIMTMFELRTFDTVFALFQSGGPQQGARVLGVYLYERFTNSYDFGISSAVAYVILAVTMLFSLGFARGAIRGAGE